MHRFTITDAAGNIDTYPAVIYTAQSWMLLNNITSDERLLPIDCWTAIERTHYMGSSKVFVLVDRPFWKDIDPATGCEVMSMTLTDRMSRGTYLLDQGDDEKDRRQHQQSQGRDEDVKRPAHPLRSAAGAAPRSTLTASPRPCPRCPAPRAAAGPRGRRRPTP